MLEFGLVAGRLCRHNVAICRYGDVEMPSDLKGLTVISMEQRSGGSAENAVEFQSSAEESVRKWAQGTLGTAERIPRTQLFHGYTGRWGFTTQIKTWRGLNIESPSYCYVHGAYDLLVRSNGRTGYGCASGRLTFKIVKQPQANQPFQGEFRVSHDIANVLCSEDGGLTFTSNVFTLQSMTASGEPPPELGGLLEPPEPWPYYWNLRPTGAPRTLQGNIRTDVGGASTEGIVTAVKEPEGLFV